MQALPEFRVLCSRHGVKDARPGSCPFLWGVLFHKEMRPQLLRSGLASVRNLMAVAILLDIISQYLIFAHPGLFQVFSCKTRLPAPN
jgi:hypothetical protein